MNYCFQVIRRSDGVRSPAAEATREAFAGILAQMRSEHSDQLAEDDYVLVLAEGLGQDDAVISQAPIMTVGHFLQYFAPESRPNV